MPTDEQVAAVAMAIYKAATGAERPNFGGQPESVQRFYRRQGRAAIAAYERAVTKTDDVTAKRTPACTSAGAQPVSGPEDVTHVRALAAFAREVIEAPSEHAGGPNVRHLAAKRDLMKWTKQGFALADWLKAIPACAAPPPHQSEGAP